MALSVQNPFVFGGRRNRGTYFLWICFITLLAALYYYEIWPVLETQVFITTILQHALVSCPLTLLTLSTTSQRLRDLDWSSWWCLLALVPIIGQLWIVLLVLIPGTHTVNRYGEASLFEDS